MSHATLQEYRMTRHQEEDRIEYFTFQSSLQPLSTQLNQAIKTALCWAQTYVNRKNRELHILYLETRLPFRGQKLGMHLLQRIAEVYRGQVDSVLLDDCSDGIAPRNLYFKLGFQVQSRYDRWIKWYPNGSLNGCERKIAIELLANWPGSNL